MLDYSKELIYGLLVGNDSAQSWNRVINRFKRFGSSAWLGSSLSFLNQFELNSLRLDPCQTGFHTNLGLTCLGLNRFGDQLDSNLKTPKLAKA